MKPAIDQSRLAPAAAEPALARRARDLPPALLTDATWYGTLAAARDLGGRGVPVVLASDRYLAPARWSRHVSRTVRCPPVSDAQRFLDWLHSFSARHPGHVFHPTSDDTAWLACAHRPSLEPSLRMHLPPLGALARLLDKWSLAEAARDAGLGTPETWCPRDDAEVERLSRELPFPLVVKPRMQVLSDGMKGVVVHRREELLAAWRARRDSCPLHAEVSRHVPDAGRPLVQAFRGGSERIYTLDGFITEDGGEFVTRGCTKLMQLPRGSGPGIAFEAAPVDAGVADGLRRLLRNVGFVGVFDAEFVVHGGRPLLIDLNPRFYNHMAFEVDRGMALPWMAYLAALGDRETLRAEIRASHVDPGSGRVYAHRNSLRLLLAAQRLAGAMPRDEVRAWRRWLATHAADMTDPASAQGDRVTGLVDSVFIAQRLLRHPRSSLRNFAGAGACAALPAAASEGRARG